VGLGKWLLATLALCSLMLAVGLIGYFILGAVSVIGLLLGAVLTVLSTSVLHRLGSREVPQAPSKREIAAPAALSHGEGSNRSCVSAAFGRSASCRSPSA
jgi:hypothetical protein